jgi:hypothetical protein
MAFLRQNLYTIPLFKVCSAVVFSLFVIVQQTQESVLEHFHT